MGSIVAQSRALLKAEFKLAGAEQARGDVKSLKLGLFGIKLVVSRWYLVVSCWLVDFLSSVDKRINAGHWRQEAGSQLRLLACPRSRREKDV